MAGSPRKGEAPQAVLGESIREALRARKIHAAVFTTYQFDPEYFELHVLPILFEEAFSRAPAILRVQLADSLRKIPHIEVFYDRRGLVASAQSAKLDYQRTDVSRWDGVFHAKNVLLLVEDVETQQKSLLVVTTSANLTRSGWSHNLEAAHILEVPQGSKSMIHKDLLTWEGELGLLESIRRADQASDPHPGIDLIRRFLTKETYPTEHAKRDGVYLPRIFSGRQTLPEFLIHEAGIGAGEYQLEIISPYFDRRPEIPALKRLQEELQPLETRVYLPKGIKGEALCKEAIYEAVAKRPDTRWASLPKALLKGGSKDEHTKERFVHAKIYRFFSKAAKADYLLLGSPNLTDAAHSNAKTKNIESAVLLDISQQSDFDWWMEALPASRPSAFEHQKSEDEPESFEPIHPFSLKFNWRTHTLSYFWERVRGLPAVGQATICAGGAPQFIIAPVLYDQWVELPAGAAAQTKERLLSNTFLTLRTDDGKSGLLLVREEEMAHKPSILHELSAQEILEYWTLLEPSQKNQFLADKLRKLFESKSDAAPESDTEGVGLTEALDLLQPESFFDRFAGIFHAFSCLKEHLNLSLEGNQEKETIYRLFGKQHDSLPGLLDKVLEGNEPDPTHVYVTLLVARQLVCDIRKEYPDFARDNRKAFKDLDDKIRRIDGVKQRFAFATEEEKSKFFAWYEGVFALPARLPEAKEDDAA